MSVPILPYNNVLDMNEFLMALFNYSIPPENIYVDTLGLFVDFHDTVAVDFSATKSKQFKSNPIKCKREYLYIKVFVSLPYEFRKKMFFNTDIMTLVATKYLSSYVRFNNKIYLFVHDITAVLPKSRHAILESFPIPKHSEFAYVDTDIADVQQMILSLWFRQVYPLIDTSKIDFKKEEDIWNTLSVKNSHLTKYKKVLNDFAILDATYEKLIEAVYLNTHPNFLDEVLLVLYNDAENEVEGRFVKSPDDMRKNKIGLLIEHQSWAAENSASLLSDLSGLKIKSSYHDKPLQFQNNYQVIIATRYIYDADIMPGFHNVINKITFAGTPTKLNEKNSFDPYIHLMNKDEMENRLITAMENNNEVTLDRFFGINATHYGNLTYDLPQPYIIKDFTIPDVYRIVDIYNKPVADLYPIFAGIVLSFLTPLKNIKQLALFNKSNDYAFSNMNLNIKTSNNLYMANLYFYVYGEKIETKLDEPLSADKAFATHDIQKIKDMLNQLQQNINLAQNISNVDQATNTNIYALLTTYKDLLLLKNRLKYGTAFDTAAITNLASKFNLDVNYLFSLMNAQNYRMMLQTILQPILAQYNMLHLLPEILNNMMNKYYLKNLILTQLQIPHEIKSILIKLFKL